MSLLYINVIIGNLVLLYKSATTVAVWEQLSGDKCHQVEFFTPTHAVQDLTTILFKKKKKLAPLHFFFILKNALITTLHCFMIPAWILLFTCRQTTLRSFRSVLQQSQDNIWNCIPEILLETWDKWGRSPASSPHSRAWPHTASAACQSLCSACSGPGSAGCTGGSSQTPGRCLAWAAGCRTGQL